MVYPVCDNTEMSVQPPINEVLQLNPKLGTVDEVLETGLSESFVFVLSKENRKSVLKMQTDSTEYRFYLEFAPEKFPNPRWLPDVLSSGRLYGWTWLQLEYIPISWPGSKWNSDQRALGILKTLHETPVSRDEFEWMESNWRPADLMYCKDVLPVNTCDLLVRYQQAYSEITGTDIVLCSGDPYPLNWLERQNGELVKIDWQGLALEHRAYDLAGWISTLITFGEIQQIARLYLTLDGAVPSEKDLTSLTRAIVVFYVRRCSLIFKQAAESTHPARWQSGIETITRQFPSWLETVNHVL